MSDPTPLDLGAIRRRLLRWGGDVNRDREFPDALDDLADLLAEVERLRGARLLSVVFGHHEGAPRPFALYRREDATGVSGTGVVALGSEFPDGMVVLRWTSDWPTSVVFHERGIESVEAIHGHGGKTQVVWLSDELEPLAEAEQRIEALTAERDEARAELALAQRALIANAITKVATRVLDPYVLGHVYAASPRPGADEERTEPERQTGRDQVPAGRDVERGHGEQHDRDEQEHESQHAVGVPTQEEPDASA